MGEKEQGAATAREAGSGMATGRVSPETNVAQSDAEGGGIAIDEEGVQRTGQPLGSAAYAATGRESAIGEDDWEAPVSLATGDLDGDGNGIAIGDPGVNGNIVDDPAATAINNSHSNIKNLRLGSGGLDDDGGGTLDESPVSVVKTKTKSNQSNDRLGQEGVAIEGTPKTPIP